MPWGDCTGPWWMSPRGNRASGYANESLVPEQRNGLWQRVQEAGIRGSLVRTLSSAHACGGDGLS